MLALALAPIFIAGQSGVRIEFMPPVGKTYKYRMTMDMKMEMPNMGKGAPAGPMDMRMKSDMQIRVLNRVGDATNLETKMGTPQLSGSLAKMMGSQADQVSKAAGKAGTSTIDRHYHLKVNTGPGAQFSSAFGSVSFPNRPLHIGESWVESIDLGKAMGGAKGPMAAGSGTLPMKYTLLGVQGSGADRVARLGVSADTTVNASPMGQAIAMHIKMQGVMTIDLATGMYHSSNMNMDMEVPIMGHTMKQHMVQAMTRL